MFMSEVMYMDQAKLKLILGYYLYQHLPSDVVALGSVHAEARDVFTSRFPSSHSQITQIHNYSAYFSYYRCTNR